MVIGDGEERHLGPAQGGLEDVAAENDRVQRQDSEEGRTTPAADQASHHQVVIDHPVRLAALTPDSLREVLQ